MPIRTLVLTSAILLTGLTAYAQAPPIFSGSDIDQAITTASDGEGLVVVDFTATWCPPCQEMDKTTWVNPDVVDWFDKHAVAVQVDVDDDEAISKTFSITAMPTLVAIVDGEEFDRSVGYLDGPELIDWLDGVQRGERKIDRLIATHGDRIDENGQVDTRARYDLAKELTRSREYEKATEEYLWLWQHMLEFEPSMVGVRSSFMAGDISELVAQHQPARTAFAQLRDQAEQRLELQPDWDDLDDWIVLNDILGDDDKTLEWFDRIKQDPDKLQAASRLSFRFDDILRDRDRWADLGRIYRSPIQEVRRDVSLMQMTLARREDQPADLAAMQIENFLDSSAQTYAACLAADREQEAQDVADFLITVHDPDQARLALIRMSLKAGQPRPIHLDWLDAMETEPPDLRAKIKSGLAADLE
jgi:thiol-disulfide isomerase/thioredoxin